MRKLIVLALACANFAANAQVKPDTLSIEDAMSKQIITNEITGIGGYQEKCVQFSLENKTNKLVWIKVLAGRRLDSVDSTKQDILLVESKRIKLNAFEKLIVPMRGFCCQAHNGAPGVDTKFRIGSMANPGLVQIAQFISRKTLPAHAIQSAIWIISDDHDISSISNTENNSEIVALQREVSRIKGIEIPWYTSYYKSAPNQVSSNQRQRISADVDYRATENGKVIIRIISEKGEVMEEQSNFCQRGTCHYHLEWEVENIPSGIYYLKIFDETKTIKDLKIVL